MFLGTSYLEWSAVLSTALCIFLAGRNNVHTWWIGIVACILYGFLFYEAKLYADVTLQVFFVITGLIGWWNWSTSQTFKQFGNGEKSLLLSIPLPITHTSWPVFGIAFSVAILAAIGYGLILHKFTDAYAPMLDSLVLMLSVLAQVLLMQRKVENWPVWLIVNTLAVPLFLSRELYLSAAMYSVFFVNALISWKHWIKLHNEQVKV